ncbi:MAG TPA: S1/P1 nuclease, partial [Pyrinomonadaceae bacterium]|nr:S1/P1 nuclease [Pyrinomonadaceae bacterium]
LITHYLGDIHQPLHVGAEYFKADGVAFHPIRGADGFADQGGNKLALFTFTDGSFNTTGNLHSFWDGKTVDSAFGKTANTTVARRLAAQTPARWRLKGDAETWAEQMADDILPFAREARTRLEYRNIRIIRDAHFIESGEAREKRGRRRASYLRWSGGVVRNEIHKGGWRLAAVLEEALR